MSYVVLVEGGRVVNTIVVGDYAEWAASNAALLAALDHHVVYEEREPGQPAIGWTWDGKTLAPPAPPALSLEEARAAKAQAIDAVTQALIARGFTFNGKRFSLSAQAQATLLGTNSLKDSPYFTWPITWPTVDDNDVTTISGAQEFEMFFLTAVGTIRAILESGNALKVACTTAATLEELSAIVDPRTP